MVTREQVMQEAAQWHGTPYVWGGVSKGARGADCSGFVGGVFRNLGVPFSAGVRTAEQIRQECIPINWQEARPGDLFFLENTYANPEHIDQWGSDGHIATHIGFILEDGSLARVLDANSTRGNVGISHWNNWWDNHYLDVRRPPQLLDADASPVPEEPTPEEQAQATTESFVGNLLAPDGELQGALSGIFEALNDGRSDDAHALTDALINRVQTLWREWTGETDV